MKKEWYVVNTVSGHEYKVKEKLEMRINSMDLHENIFRVIVPEQKEIEYKNGVKKEILVDFFWIDFFCLDVNIFSSFSGSLWI